MSVLECIFPQDTGEGNLGLQNDQTAGQSELPPISRVDENLQISNENFKESVDVFFKQKNTPPPSQPTKTPPFPTPRVLAQFASKAYTDYQEGENDAQYETRLDLSDGWKLLTTASNETNGYFGAAYWHPEHQQVVIAHRGTERTNLGARSVHKNLGEWSRNINGVLPNQCVPKMESASTFAHKVVEGLQFFTPEKEVGFQLFFTGQCLGGWLAQITTFTTKYLNIEGNVFLKSTNDKDCYHPHTVVFDSPGCKNMLSEMADKFGRSMDLEQLDITSYLSAPNLINTSNRYLGTVFCFYTELRSVEWSDYINNYCPEFREEVLQVQGNHPIIYQTETYDKRVRSLRVFSQQEQQFLKDYLQLRQLPELFEPKEIFSSMKNNQAQEEAEKILQNFEIVNQTIRCPDVNTLQNLIPYVKQLLQLFPQIKERTKSALLSYDAIHRFYQLQTRRYREQINQSFLHFEADAMSLSEILKDGQHQVILLQIADGDEWTGLSMAYQVLRKNNSMCDGQYIILALQCLFRVSQLMDLSTLMQSIETPYLLLIACENNQLLNDEEEEILKTLFNTIKEKQNIKIILIAQSRDISMTFLQKIGNEKFGKGFLTKSKQLTLSDVTTSSQEKLLEKPVSFQGSTISLKELVPCNSTLGKYLPLGALLEGKQLAICEPRPTSNKYSESYYIGRTLCHQKTIKQGIFYDEDVGEKLVFLATEEQEFEEWCQQYPNSNVHWLDDQSGKLIWQQSQGSLETLRKYIDTESSLRYPADDLKELLEQAKHQRVMLISDAAGKGKSTLLAHLGKQIKQKFPAKLVVRIDLNICIDALKSQEKGRFDRKKTIEFLSKELLHLEHDLEMELFKQCCEKEQNVRTVVMMDCCDEISQSNKDTLIDFLLALRQTAVEQLWVTTRPHLREEMEDMLQQLSYTLEPFSEEKKVEFSLGLCEGFVAEKYELYLENKTANRMRSDAAKLKLQHILECAREDHQLLALQMLFGEELLAQLTIEDHCTLSAKCLTKIGIAKECGEGNLQFIDDSFATYFVAHFLVDQLTSGTQHSQNVQDILLNNIFLESSYKKIRLFIDGLLSNSKPLKETLKQYGNRMEEIREYCEQTFHQAAYEGNANIVGFYLESLEVAKHADTINELLLAQDKEGKTAWHVAAFRGNIKVLDKLWDWAVNKLTTNVLKDKLLLATDCNENTAWNVAAKNGKTEVLQKIWELAKKELTPEELKNNLFFAKDDRKQTALHVAAQLESIEVLLKLWQFAKEELMTKDVKNNLLLVKDLCGLNAWLHTKEVSHKQMLERLKEVCDWAKQELTPEDLTDKCMLATGFGGKTAWHIATEAGKIEHLEKLWEWAKGREILPSKLMLAKDENDKTAFHVAAERSYTEVLQKLWDWAIENPQSEELHNKLLLSTSSSGITAWHTAAELGNTEILKKIWEWAKEKLMPSELNDKLLLATDINRQNVLHLAVKGGDTKVIEEIWKQCKETLNEEDLRNKLLLAKDCCERTAWHLAAELGKIEILQKIWDWAENLKTEENDNKLLLGTDDRGRTGWHMAAKKNDIKVLEKIWEWANKQLKLEDLKSFFLLAKDRMGKTAWHAAAKYGNTEVLHKLCKWAKLILPDGLQDILFVVKDNKGRTVRDVAESTENSELLFEFEEWVKERKKIQRKPVANRR